MRSAHSEIPIRSARRRARGWCERCWDDTTPVVQRVPLQTPLFWRVLAINGALFIIAALTLGPILVTIGAPIPLPQAVVVDTGFATLIVAASLLLRPFVPSLERLVRRMRSVDFQRPGHRVPPSESPEVAELGAAFNVMPVELAVDGKVARQS